MTSSAKVELPKASSDAKVDEKALVILQIDKENTLSIDEIVLNEDNLASVLLEKAGGNYDG